LARNCSGASRRGVELTEAGIALRNEAASIFASIERAVDTVVRGVAREHGEIRIGLTTSACFHPLPPQANPVVPARQSTGEDRVRAKQPPGLIAALQAAGSTSPSSAPRSASPQASGCCH